MWQRWNDENILDVFFKLIVLITHLFQISANMTDTLLNQHSIILLMANPPCLIAPYDWLST